MYGLGMATMERPPDPDDLADGDDVLCDVDVADGDDVADDVDVADGGAAATSDHFARAGSLALLAAALWLIARRAA